MVLPKLSCTHFNCLDQQELVEAIGHCCPSIQMTLTNCSAWRVDSGIGRSEKWYGPMGNCFDDVRHHTEHCQNKIAIVL